MTKTPEGCIIEEIQFGSCQVLGCKTEIIRLRGGQAAHIGKLVVDPAYMVCAAARQEVKNIVSGHRSSKGNWSKDRR